ncbi:HAD family phosphatase [Bacteroidaceae bacterium HV4-6-C5C]|jgi:haloacid dehalogenase superfamily, subfamily IA, variant 3 with third motif having DD or ED|nr:HAD family phosphatase [Bacteroidaceae bacterium HV4-6-C5C]
MNKIKNLIIDFGGVLIDLDRQKCVDNFAKLGLYEVKAMLDVYHQHGFFLQHEKGLITSADFRDGIRKSADLDVSDEQIDAAWNSFLVGIPNNKLELLLALRKNYNLYLLSNTNAIHWKWSCENAFLYDGYRVEDFFDKIYLSFELKMAKPDLDIFQYVLDDIKIDSSETLFIDDSADNCRVANTLGISTYAPLACEDWSHLFDNGFLKDKLNATTSI